MYRLRKYAADFVSRFSKMRPSADLRPSYTSAQLRFDFTGHKPKAGDPRLHALWLELRRNYFPARPDLDSFSLRWSGRNNRYTLGSCNNDRRTVRVAKALDTPDTAWVLAPLLYHEMCHAFLGKPGTKNGRRVIHGLEFRRLEQLHPDIPRMDAWIKNGGWSTAVRRFKRSIRAGQSLCR